MSPDHQRLPLVGCEPTLIRLLEPRNPDHRLSLGAMREYLALHYVLKVCTALRTPAFAPNHPTGLVITVYASAELLADTNIDPCLNFIGCDF